MKLARHVEDEVEEWGKRKTASDGSREFVNGRKEEEK